MDHDDTDTLPLLPLLGPAQAAVAPATARSLSERLRGSAQSYLPAFLLALLAILTWWLVKQTPMPSTESEPAAPSHAPDYEMSQFSVQHYTEAGPARGVIAGNAMRHYPDTDTLEIDGVRVRWSDAQGRMLHASARQATADNRTGEVWLIGGAKVVQDPIDGVHAPLEFSGERMLFDTRAGVVISRDPVIVRQGPHRFEAGSVRYEHETRTALLGQGVKGRLDPVEASASGLSR